MFYLFSWICPMIICGLVSYIADKVWNKYLGLGWWIAWLTIIFVITVWADVISGAIY